jgi:transcriptional regulator with XRE-family HTH domain
MPEPSPATFAQVLQGLMTARGLTQAKLAEALGVWDGNIRRWRTGGGIEIENVWKLADFFGVDRNYMARLAGYPDNLLSGAPDTVSPEMAAIADAERADLLAELRNFPPQFWDAILFTQRAGRRLAVDVARKALELTQPVQPTISTSPGSALAPPTPRRRRDRRRDDNAGSEPLARLFALAGAH